MTARPCLRLVPLLVLAASALSAQGEKPLRPFWGTMTGEVRWVATDVCLPHQPVETRFTAKGELAGLGRATLSGSHCATDDGGAVNGGMTFTANDGDQLEAAFTARLVAQSDSLIVQELSLVFADGGSGRFARASGAVKGTAYAHKTAEPPTLASAWPVEFVFAGTLVY